MKQSDVKRVYVVKKTEFAIEAKILLQDIQENLGIKSLQQLRIYNRYDVSGLTTAEYETAKNQVFSEIRLDDVFDEITDFDQADHLIGVEPLPGQYDQRADSASQCIQIITEKEKPLCKTAKIYALFGDLELSEVEKIKQWLINPVEAGETTHLKPTKLDLTLTEPEEIKQVANFINLTEKELIALLKDARLALSLTDLMFIQKFFISEKRNPTWTELRVLDTYWSDHCRHTTFLTDLETIEFSENTPSCLGTTIKNSYDLYLKDKQEVAAGKYADRALTLMSIATQAVKVLKAEGKLEALDESEEINACSINAKIEVDGKAEDYLILFKNETHNHPTEIEPFGGAATCLGGAIRDPLSGRAYVYQAMRITGSANPTEPLKDTLPSKLPQKKITKTACHGYSSYGNQIGLATGLVHEIYHPGYKAKRLEIGAVVASVPKKQVVREVPCAGDMILLIGGRTGRDGVGGATGSSKAHDKESLEKSGSEVQKGNPVTERKLQRLFRNDTFSKKIKRCNDFGAGGVAVAVGELADGLRINLDAVPKKYEGLDGTELAISESQERMAVVVQPGDVEYIIEAAYQENLEATVIAEVTEEARLIMTWRNQTIVDLARDFLSTNGAMQKAKVCVKIPEEKDFNFAVNQFKMQDLKAGITSKQDNLDKNNVFSELQARLSDLNFCSQRGMTEYFDSSIGAATVLMPYGGKFQKTPEQGMAAKIATLKGETTECSLMSYGFDPYLSAWSPYHGAYYAIFESINKIVALGGSADNIWLSLQEYFERLETPEQWGKPFAALLGAYQAQIDYAVAAIGGKDSMSGTFNELKVPPTLVSFALSHTNAQNVTSSVFPKAGLKIIHFPLQKQNNLLPDPQKSRAILEKLKTLQQSQKILAATTVERCGLAVNIIKSCFGNQLGFKFNDNIDENKLFEFQVGSIVIAVAEDFNCETLNDLDYQWIGFTTNNSEVQFNQQKIDLNSLINSFEKPLNAIYPVTDLAYPSAVSRNENKPLQEKIAQKNINIKNGAKPRVFIPIFPGTNCEYDSRRAFEAAGAEVNTVLIKNINGQALRTSISDMERAIKDAQIIMLPGGFSAGDEPEGSAKFITALFRNEKITAAVEDLMDHRDGLILGICNGFQALVKLGLLPYGKIVPSTPQMPTLTFNTIGRHISRYVTTKALTNKSPWLNHIDLNSNYAIPVSHGEGRFIVTEKELLQLKEQQQIAFAYTDTSGEIDETLYSNVNGSTAAIEGLISKDGRILGKMGHSERLGKFVAKNIAGDKDQSIFQSGVEYFTK